MAILHPNSSRCLCRACGEFFNSVSVFDEHRRAGRCLSGDEMRARGWLVSTAGFWITRLRGEPRMEARTRGQNSPLQAEPVSTPGVQS
jgi:hypothetical protein